MSTTTRTGFDAGRALSYVRIETLARHVRQVLGLSPTHSVPGVTLFEGLRKYKTATLRGVVHSLDYGVEELPDGIEAETRLEQGSNKIVVVLSPESYAALEEDQPRARFCLCHEIGHAVCHCDMLVRLSGIQHARAALMRRASTHPAYRDTEWQANAFAGALLMPGLGLHELQTKQRGVLSPAALQRTFIVSRQSADIRLTLWDERRKDLLLQGGASAP